jgi:hypothetical protein
MRYVLALSVLAGALAVTGAASAGGWATVGLSSQPTGIGPGDSWSPEITVLQHGRTPLEGLTPTITISESGTGATRSFTATATDEPGVYAARVVFPQSGDWNVAVETGWWGEGNLTFGPVTVEDGPAGGLASASFPVLPLALGALLVALLAGGTIVLRRHWRPTALSR